MINNHNKINNNNNIKITESEQISNNNIINNINNKHLNTHNISNNISENNKKSKKNSKTNEKTKNNNDIISGIINNNNNQISDLNININNNIIDVEGENNNHKFMRIVTQNIRGITSIAKQMNWLNYCIEKDFDIIGLTETWAKEENCKYIFKNDLINETKNVQNEYTYIWANGKQTNGSGVGIIIKNKWAKHIYRTKKYEGNVLSISLAFKKKIKVKIIAVYYPSNPEQRKERAHVTKWMINEIGQFNNNDKHYTIIMGDFNATVNPKIDRYNKNISSNNRSNKPESSILRFLDNNKFIDTFRIYKEAIKNTELQNNTELNFTWENGSGEIKSRIDYIWISDNLADQLFYADIISAHLTSQSDHACVIIEIETNIFEKLKPMLETTECSQRIEFNFKGTNEKKWKKFEQEIEKAIEQNKIKDNDINKKWNFFRKTIIQIANEIIPKKKFLTFRKEEKSKTLHNHYITFRKVVAIRKIFNWGRQWYTNKKQRAVIEFKVSQKIEEIKKEYEIDIVKPSWKETNEEFQIWLREVKRQHQLFHKIFETEIKEENYRGIQKRILARNKNFLDNKTKVIRSLLNRERPRIITDSIVRHVGTEVKMITNPTELKQEIQNTFTHWVTKERVEDPEHFLEWKEIYSNSESQIREEWYSTLIQEFTTEEISKIIRKSPNKKAPGPSTIANELWKHMGNNAIQYLVDLFNQILQKEEIPKEWKIGHIFPIAKPKDWEKNIWNTRPITLLETARKIFTKGIYNRLSKILVEYKILNENNWAGLPTGSTQGPIHILNNCIEEAKEFNKELWILSQDISKAFDSINVEVLKKSMKRIKIPNKIINILNNLISNRSSRVITFYGLTDEFNPETGIEQGDALSPLLWRIYYDPLLTKIQNLEEGYYMETQKYGNLRKTKIETKKLKINAIAYMDDTTYLTSNRKQMETILQSVEEFTKITGIKINAEKSRLICINNKTGKQSLNFMKEKINAIGKHDQIRILGVYLAANGKKQYQKNLIEEKVKNTCRILTWKKATDKEIRYIINHVLFPAIEYLLNDIIISKKQCNHLNSMCLKVIKHKAGFAQTAINSMFYLPEGYKLFDIYDRQLQLHIKNLSDRLNKKDNLGNSTIIRLQQFQNYLWTDKEFIKMKDTIKIKDHFNLTASIINLAKEINITWQITKTGTHDLNIPYGGKILIEDIWNNNKKQYEKYKKSLREKRILYIEQIMDINFKNILEWSHIQAKYTKRKGRIPGWYTYIKENEQEIMELYREKIRVEYKNNINPFIRLNNEYKLSKSKWIASRKNDQTIIGKELKEKSNKKEKVKYISHYNILQEDTEPTSILVPCEGCSQNIEKGNKCIIGVEEGREKEIEIPVAYSKLSTSGSKTDQYKNRLRMSYNSITKAMEIIDSIQNKMDEEDTEEEKEKEKEKETGEQQNNNIIDKWITAEDTIYEKLKKIQRKIKDQKIIKVYTDGSLEDHKMGLGWVIPSQEGEKHIKFRCNIEYFPSSTRAELAAILTALLVMPKEATIHIYTDSMCAIFSLCKIIKKEKEFIWKDAQNPIILQVIDEIINELNLKINLHKVEAHTGNLFNEIADSLAKIPLTQIKQEIITIKHQNIKSRSYIPTWNSIPIETSVKLIVKKHNLIKKRQKWKSQNRFQEIFVNQEKTQKIDWCTTFKTLHPSKITNNKTNREDQVKRSFAMKLLNEELPVMTRRFQHQPHIYKDPKCVLCGRYEENNLHVFECKRNNNNSEYKPMINHYEKLIEYLTDKIYEETKDISKETINTRLRSISELYLWNIDDQDQRTFHHVNLYDIIRGLIPHSLINKVAKLLKSKIKARRVVIEGVGKFKEHLHECWKERCERVIEWELQNNITNKVKKRKNRNSNNNNINREENIIDTELNEEINIDRDNQITAREEKKEMEKEMKKVIEEYTVHNLETWIKYGSYYNINYCYRYHNFI